jgi:hypothetical protein
LKYAKIKKEGYVFFANFSLLDLNWLLYSFGINLFI